MFSRVADMTKGDWIANHFCGLLPKNPKLIRTESEAGQTVVDVHCEGGTGGSNGTVTLNNDIPDFSNVSSFVSDNFDVEENENMPSYYENNNESLQSAGNAENRKN